MAHFHPLGTVWIAILVLSGAGSVAGLIWAAVAWKTPKKRRMVGALAGILLALAAGTLVVFVGVPYVLAFLRGTLSRNPSAASAPAGTQAAATRRSSVPLALGAGAGLLATIASVAGWVRITLRSATAEEKAVASRLRRFILNHRAAAINLLAAVAGPLLTVALALMIINVGAAHPPGANGASAAGPLALLLGPLALFVALYLVADINSWSLHPYYKQHLSEAFALARVRNGERSSTTAVDTDDGRQDAEPRRHESPYPVSASQPHNGPAVLICATANVNDYGKVPTGFNATSFVFSADGPHAMGGPAVGYCKARAYERAMPRRITLPAAIAAAGAAISPEMGKMTRRPLRFLMTLANIRLGVWLPNPEFVAGRKGKKDRVEQLRRWVWTKILHKKEENLPYRRPRPRYLFRELLGRNHLDSHFLYITDGGHYENLGLVELLRRRCKTIVCIDGSGEKQDSFGTIGQAFATAKAELDTTIDLDARSQMGPRPGGPAAFGHPDLLFAQSAFAQGNVQYADGQTGTLIVVKAAVTKNTPWDIRAWQETHPSFPSDSTLNQFFTAEQFDAYRALGEYAMTEALADGAIARTMSVAVRKPASETVALTRQ